MKARNIFKLTGVLAVAALVGLCTIAGQKTTAAPNGEAVFKNNCAGCHTGGKNDLDPKKPIIGSKKLKSVGDFKEFISKGAGNMPPQTEVVKDDQAVRALFTYCKSLK
jgi:mono/diheme cytochrome c family protein